MTRAMNMPPAIHSAGHLCAHLVLGTPDLPSLVGVGGPATCPHSTWSPRSLAGLPVPPSRISVLGRPAARLEARQVRAWREIVGDLCGPVAEARWRTRSREAALANGIDAASECFARGRPDTGSDIGRVRTRLEWMGEPDGRASFLRAWREAEYLLANDWARVVAVARIVIGAGLQPGHQVTEVWASLPERSVNADWLPSLDDTKRPL